MKPRTQISGVLKAHRSNVRFPMSVDLSSFCFASVCEKKREQEGYKNQEEEIKKAGDVVL